jgi:hypothetical protein
VSADRPNASSRWHVSAGSTLWKTSCLDVLNKSTWTKRNAREPRTKSPASSLPCCVIPFTVHRVEPVPARYPGPADKHVKSHQR